MISIDKSLSSKRPDLVKEWDIDLNSLTPETITWDSQEKVHWKCQKGHKWQMRVVRRTRKAGKCPLCNRIDGKFVSDSLRLLLEWNYEKNQEFSPKTLKLSSNKKVWWTCKSHHDFIAIPNNRRNGFNCPYCSGNKVSDKNSLAKNYPELIKEWDYRGNKGVDINRISFGSNKKRWWICNKCGKNWEAMPLHRSNGSGCPICALKYVTRERSMGHKLNYLLVEWDYSKNTDDPYSISCSAKKKYWWKCKKGHVWPASVLRRNYDGTGCPSCNKIILKTGETFDSLTEAFIYLSLIKKHTMIIVGQRYPSRNGQSIGNRKFDFYIPSENKYVEVTGFKNNYFLSFGDYKDYLANISLKKKYVKDVLLANFEFIQRKLSSSEKLLVRQNM